MSSFDLFEYSCRSAFFSKLHEQFMLLLINIIYVKNNKRIKIISINMAHACVNIYCNMTKNLERKQINFLPYFSRRENKGVS